MEKKDYIVLILAFRANLMQILPIVKYLKKENPSAVLHLLTCVSLDSVTSPIKEYVSKIIYVKDYMERIKENKLAAFLNKGRLFFPLVWMSIIRKKYDAVNIHYAEPYQLKAMPWVKKITNNIVITPWGSDVLRVEDENAINRLQKIYEYASCVTCNPNTQLGEAVINKFKCDPRKIHSVRFGLEYVDYIEGAKPNKTEDEAKERFGLSGKYVITCGYSTAPSHRHEAIVDAVNSIKDQLPNNLILLFPFTYSWGSQEYIQSVKNKCQACGINAVYVEDYLNMEDLYTLRMATDMFVHVQTTDAGASCVMQYILCHKKIVHGSWMKYYDLEQYKPLFYYPVENMEELGIVILKAYQSDGIDIPEEVVNTIMDRGWKKEIKKWDALFSSMAINSLGVR